LNKKGVKVLLFFTSSIGCLNCRGTIHDIFELQEQLLKLNCVPVIAHEEGYEKYEKFINSSEETKKFKDLLHLERKSVSKHFKLKNFNKLSETAAFIKRGLSEMKRLKGLGLKNEPSYFTKETETLLAAVFVVYDNKVISEYRKEHKYQRFDVARILIDTDGRGIEVRTSIFECTIPKKKEEKKLMTQVSMSKLTKTVVRKSSFFGPKEVIKEKKHELVLDEVLKNQQYFKYFKLYATNEFSVENVIFFEEVELYRKMKEDERIEHAEKMIETFLSADSIYELNTSKKLVDLMKIEKEKECGEELFDPILKDVKMSNLSDTFGRFIISDLFQEMLNKKKNRKKTYFLFQ
jgi:hypothetical protein